MKWIQHLTRAHDDPAILSIIKTNGVQAYAVYWLILEHIASKMEAGHMEPEATHSTAMWAELCHVSAPTFSKIAASLHATELISMHFCAHERAKRLRKWSELVHLEIPKLLKYMDEYAKKSGQKSDKCPDTTLPYRTVPNQKLHKPGEKDTLPTPSQPPKSAEPKTEVCERKVAVDDGFGEFRYAATNSGLNGSNDDWGQAHWSWKMLDHDQKHAAIVGLDARRMCGEFSDPAYRPLPQNYLVKRIWTREVRNKASPPPKAAGKFDQRVAVLQNWINSAGD